MTMSKKLIAEAIGTFWLVLGGCGSAVLAAKFGSDLEGPFLGIGLVGVSFAFGLTVLTMAYAVGHISGGHFNPAVTIMTLYNRGIAGDNAVAYIVAQVAAGLLAVTVYKQMRARGVV